MFDHSVIVNKDIEWPEPVLKPTTTVNLNRHIIQINPSSLLMLSRLKV